MDSRIRELSRRATLEGDPKKYEREAIRAGGVKCCRCDRLAVEKTERCPDCTWAISAGDGQGSTVFYLTSSRVASFCDGVAISSSPKIPSNATYVTPFSRRRVVEKAVELLKANQHLLDDALDSKPCCSISPLEKFITLFVPFFAEPEEWMGDLIPADLLRFPTVDTAASYYCAQASDTCAIDHRAMVEYLRREARNMVKYDCPRPEEVSALLAWRARS